MTVSAGSPRAGRLLAMLLVVLLAASSLAAQAAMDGCTADCGPAQVEMLDHAEPECGACAAMAATPLVILAYPDTLGGVDGPASVEFIAPPPREPPRP